MKSNIDLVVIAVVAALIVFAASGISECDGTKDKRVQTPGEELDVVELKSVPDGVRCFALRYKGRPVSGQAGISCVTLEKR